MKSSPNFPHSYQNSKVVTASFAWKVMFFNRAQKVTKYLGYFGKKFSLGGFKNHPIWSYCFFSFENLFAQSEKWANDVYDEPMLLDVLIIVNFRSNVERGKVRSLLRHRPLAQSHQWRHRRRCCRCRRLQRPTPDYIWTPFCWQPWGRFCLWTRWCAISNGRAIMYD